MKRNPTRLADVSIVSECSAAAARHVHELARRSAQARRLRDVAGLDQRHLGRIAGVAVDGGVGSDRSAFAGDIDCASADGATATQPAAAVTLAKIRFTLLVRMTSIRLQRSMERLGRERFGLSRRSARGRACKRTDTICCRKRRMAAAESGQLSELDAVKPTVEERALSYLHEWNPSTG